MKAFLLAGGRGERLQPLTISCPKCLIPINGVPLLDIWLGHCCREGITDVLLNVSHHVDLVRDYLATRPGSPSVTLLAEEEPHGTAGTVLGNRWFADGEEDIWVLYADNLTECSLQDMLRTHRRHQGPLTMGLFHAPVPTAAGIVQMDQDGRIVAFEEKPSNPVGNLANAGVYLIRAELLGELSPVNGGVLDFGFHVLPGLVNRMYGHVIEQFHMDIGTPTALTQASAAWAQRKEQGGR